MASKNSVKVYVENGFYHLYNRGVEKRIIFQDSQDYNVFLSYVREYLSPKNKNILLSRLQDPSTTWSDKGKIIRALSLNNFSGTLTLFAYCLMPNHFHFLVKQSDASSIDLFINSLNTRYVMYFNRRHKRVGHLFQDVYKAVTIKSEEQLLHLSRYIHQNPLASRSNKNKLKGDPLSLMLKQPSSLPEYLDRRETGWVNTYLIKNYFSKTYSCLSYESFVLENDLTPSITLDSTMD